ncbi:hypothetical protein HPHPA27_1135 [Helicobacter pylori Hp A-27]|uniref:hypothetical protein n=1 Tax=Helicobacter pylori TaxID=210 RepID=UPI00026AF03C|nr:hypothetical protein [Helicobacter pylori]EJB77338.1 hypothetical protein HPHPA27_1135 [Helicobacter pylori Hp A-27]
MISLFAFYYGVIFENGSELVLNSVFMGNACVFLAVVGGIEIFQNPIVLKF